MAYCEFDINRHFETKIALYVEDLDVLQASEGVVRRAQDFRPSSTPREALPLPLFNWRCSVAGRLPLKMNFGKLFPLVAMALSVYSAAAYNAAPAPASVPIYYGRPNNGGYPYPTPTPATKPYENKTETPTPPSGPIYYGRPNNGGYPYPTPAPHDLEGSYSNENGTVTPAPANVPIYYGRPNNGGYPYTAAPPQTIKEH
ncbi:hypothetical protein PC128_g21422 [Phytophthora cactorum]|nr:hypothetical protein PC128_g21422 [Phytophthora cactorum]